MCATTINEQAASAVRRHHSRSPLAAQTESVVRGRETQRPLVPREPDRTQHLTTLSTHDTGERCHSARERACARVWGVLTLAREAGGPLAWHRGATVAAHTIKSERYTHTQIRRVVGAPPAPRARGARGRGESRHVTACNHFFDCESSSITPTTSHRLACVHYYSSQARARRVTGGRSAGAGGREGGAQWPVTRTAALSLVVRPSLRWWRLCDAFPTASKLT